MKFIFIYDKKIKDVNLNAYDRLKIGLSKLGHKCREVSVDSILSKMCIEDCIRKNNILINHDAFICIGWPRYLADIIKKHNAQTLTIYDPPIRPINRKTKFANYWGVCLGQPHTNYNYSDNIEPTRWNIVKNKMNIKVFPWRNNEGGHILIGVRNADNFNGVSQLPETKKLIDECKKFNRNIILSFRNRPSYKIYSKNYEYSKCKMVNNSFKYLNNAYCLVITGGTLVSKSIINGVPCYYTDKNITDPLNITKDLNKFIVNPDKPNRSKWLNWAAYQQWTLDEISSGEALEHVFSTHKEVIKNG